MHIPDGYLSPSTCACLYGGCAPFWYRALKRLRNYRQSQSIPLLSLFAAFSFVLMMFNLPLPGGTTGHAVGVGIAAVVLGPSLSAVAISMALLIQALFFGDGGLTTYGANCFNMAIAGSYVAAAVYNLLSWRAPDSSKRRIWAAGIAGYAAVNIAALCAAIEFGIQPLLFHDSTGAPLYAPYPISIAVPAMMIGHLTIAGSAEFVVAAGLLAYLQRSRLELITETTHVRRLTGLWAVLATLLLVTPLGIIAVGSAWGEWKAPDFEDGETRQQIVRASRNESLPPGVPKGLRQLSGLWKAPASDYAPTFIASRPLGYAASAIGGAAVLVLLLKLLASLWQRRRRGVVERTSRALIEAVDQTLFAEDCWQRNGYLQHVDTRVKVVSAAILIVAAAACTSLAGLLVLCLAATLATVLSRIPIFPALTRIWIGVLLFTGAIALPALVLTPGHVEGVGPFGLAVTREGLRGAGFLLLRAGTISTICGAVALTTMPGTLLRALRSLRVPASIVASAGMTYRYVFLFIQNARSLLEAREARTVGRVNGSEQRRLATLNAGALLDKVFALSAEVFDAMSARGFRGEFYTLDDSALRSIHWFQMGAVCLAAASIVWLAR